MTTTTDSLRRNLADGSSASARADQSAEEIRKAAAERREVVGARLVELSTKAISNPGAADEYQALIRERGELDLVLGR
jgi:hypothetical protein